MYTLLVLLLSQFAFAAPAAFKKEIIVSQVGGSCAATAVDLQQTLSIVLPAKILQIEGIDAIAGQSCRVSFSYLADREVVFKTDKYSFNSSEGCQQVANTIGPRAEKKWGVRALATGCVSNPEHYDVDLEVSVLTEKEPVLREETISVHASTPKFNETDIARLKSELAKLGASDALLEPLDVKNKYYNVYFFLPAGVPQIQKGWSSGDPSSYMHSWSGASVNLTQINCEAQRQELESYFFEMFTGAYRFSCSDKYELLDHGPYISLMYIYQKGSPKKNTGYWETVIPAAGEASFANCMAQKAQVKAKFESLTGKSPKYFFCNWDKDSGYQYIANGLEK